MSEKSSTSLYQLKVILLETNPEIWRRILVPADIPLDRLHDVLQLAMGWTNSHLHQFTQGDRFFGMQEDGFGMDDEEGPEDERAFKLSDLLAAETESLGYEYDFGDSWEHQLLLEKVLPAEAGKKQAPRCLGGARACPPEDCGGAWGYEQLLETLSDPQHPEYEDMREWVGGEFDPEAFEIDQVNKALARL
jgi:hypothetical protein